MPQAQYQLVRIGPAGITGVAGLIAAAVIAVSALIPGQHALEALNAGLARAQHPQAAVAAQQGIARVVASLPGREQVPAVISQVLEQSQKAGVSLDRGHYTYTPPKSGDVGRYELEFPITAGYTNIRNFINRTLTAIPAAGLDRLRVERKTVGDVIVNADVRFVIFVRAK
jgi:hypothetical protein